MLESLNYSFRNPKKHNLSNLPHQTVEKLQKKKTMGSSEDPSLVNNVDELGLVYQGLKEIKITYEVQGLPKCTHFP